MDKKKLGLIIGVSVVVVAGAVVAILFATGVLQRPGGTQTALSTAAPTPAPVPAVTSQPGSADTSMSNPPRKVIAASGKKGKAQVRAAMAAAAKARAARLKAAKGAPKNVPSKANALPVPPGERSMAAIATGGADPFKIVVDEKSRAAQMGQRLPPNMQPPPLNIYNYKDITPGVTPGLTINTGIGDNIKRKLDGVMISDGIYALLESNDETVSVQPGSTIPGGKVVSIQPDSITVRTHDGRMITIAIGATDNGTVSASMPGGGGGASASPAGYSPPDNSSNY